MRVYILSVALLLVLAIPTLNAQSTEKNTITKNEVVFNEEILKSKKPKTGIIKTQPFSLFFNNLTLGYEKKIKNNISIDGSVGLIGVGFNAIDDIENPSGFYMTAGPKLYFGQDFSIPGMSNLALRGFYFKPELVFSRYKSKFNHYEYDYDFSDGYSPYVDEIEVDYKANSGALIFNLGRQWIAADIISFEVSVGAGYGFVSTKMDDRNDSTSKIEYYSPNFYSHLQGPKEFPIAGKADITIGVLIR